MPERHATATPAAAQAHLRQQLGQASEPWSQLVKLPGAAPDHLIVYKLCCQQKLSSVEFCSCTMQSGFASVDVCWTSAGLHAAAAPRFAG
jgi:hypothetical protein